MSKIIWISSYPKSGNTWVRYFLANYFYNKEKINSNFDILNKIDKFPPQKYLKKLVEKKELEQNAYNISKYWALTQENIIKMNEEFVFVKNHNALVSVEGRNLTDENYSCAFIHIVRDPRDIAVSYSNFDRSITIDEAIERITSENLYCHVSKKNSYDIEILGSWQFNYLSWKNGVREVPRILIRYEDLITNTFETKLRLIDFLSQILRLSTDEDHIKFSIEQSHFKRLKEIEKSTKFAESSGNFFNSGKIKQWKKLLSLKQVKKIENLCKNEMQELNYL